MYNVFKIWKDQSPEFVLPFPGSEAVCLILCLVSHTYLHYLTVEKKDLAMLLRLEEVTFPAYFVFFGKRYIMHEVCS